MSVQMIPASSRAMATAATLVGLPRFVALSRAAALDQPTCSWSAGRSIFTRTAPLTYRTVERCRACASAALERFLSLGAMPLANAFVHPDDPAPEETFPLDVLRCDHCGLVQLSIVVDPTLLFREYRYASSASPPSVEHFDAYADDVVPRIAPPGSLVVEIGSNDGILLRPLAARGVRVLGVEPASNIAARANAAGLRTLNEFFSAPVATRIRADVGPARAVVGNNVLAHIDDLGDLLAGLDALMSDDGIFAAEVPYLSDLLEHVEYDTIYHEHLSYFSLRPLRRLFRSGAMELYDAQRVAVHGGSLRIFVARSGRQQETDRLSKMLDDESRSGIDDRGAYAEFAERVAASRAALRSLLWKLREEGRTIAALGATAKGNTLLNYCGLGTEEIAYVADSTSLKQGLLTPGTHIPVRPEHTIRDERPDYTLLLAWNYADSIRRRFAEYVRGGGRFIIPVPLAQVVA